MTVSGAWTSSEPPVCCWSPREHHAFDRRTTRRTSAQAASGATDPNACRASGSFDIDTFLAVQDLDGGLRPIGDGAYAGVSYSAQAENGLRDMSLIVDKPSSIMRERLGPVFGHAGDETMLAVNRALAVFLGLA